MSKKYRDSSLIVFYRLCKSEYRLLHPEACEFAIKRWALELAKFNVELERQQHRRMMEKLNTPTELEKAARADWGKIFSDSYSKLPKHF